MFRSALSSSRAFALYITCIMTFLCRKDIALFRQATLGLYFAYNRSILEDNVCSKHHRRVLGFNFRYLNHLKGHNGTTTHLCAG
jgi:hypothetical protein